MHNFTNFSPAGRVGGCGREVRVEGPRPPGLDRQPRDGDLGQGDPRGVSLRLRSSGQGGHPLLSPPRPQARPRPRPGPLGYREDQG